MHTRLSSTPGRKWWLAQVVILLATAVFRFYRLADLPLGLHYDEAFNGLDAYALLGKPLSEWPIFLTGNFGREPLHVYLVAASQALFGPGVVSLRLVSALAGALLTQALAWLAWELALSLGLKRERLALWAAAMPLTLLWAQIHSRYATRNMPFPLLATLMWASLWRAWRGRRAVWWGISGALAGLSFYTYLPVRLLPLVLIPLSLVGLSHHRRRLVEQSRWIALGLCVSVLIAAPLAAYFVRNPVSFLTRVEQVSVFQAGGLAAIGKNAMAALGLAFVRGDGNIRNNIPGRPALDAIVSVWFAIGLALALWRIRRPGFLFLLTWLGVMLLPTVLSSYAPHFQRAIGALPPLMLLAAVGLEKAVGWLEERWPRYRISFVFGAWLSLALSAAITWQAFFGEWARDPALFGARDVGLVALAKELGSGTSDGVTYISPQGWEHPTVLYGMLESGTTAELHGFDGRTCVRIPAEAARYLILVGEDFRGPGLLQSYLPDSSARPLILGPGSQPWAVELTQPAGGRVVLPEMTPYPVDMADGISFLGYWLSLSQLQPGERLYVRLFWRGRERPLGEYTTFVHLVTADPSGALQQLAGSDARPGNGSCSTDDWLPGEIIVDELQLVLPSELSPAGSYYLTLGFYTLSDGRRLAIPGHTDDQILIGPLSSQEVD